MADHRPLALATGGADVVAVYLPVGGRVYLSPPEGVATTQSGMIPGRVNSSRQHH